jgi:hypothetical protein
MSMLDFGLGIYGLSDSQVAEIKAALPVATSILEEAKELEPILEQMRPHITALLPLATQAWPHIQKMWPQIVAETPLLLELVSFVNQKEGTS